ILRKSGYLDIRIERGLELLDAGASKAFAVADHQIAHVYIKDKSLKSTIKELLKNVPGIEQVLSDEDLVSAQINNDRCGDIVVVADANSWFTYYFWNDDEKAPDYARMVDIHKKPGYDPVELVTDPADKFVMPKVGWKLLKKKIGFRTVLNIIPLDAKLIKGSHGRKPEHIDDYPICISNKKNSLTKSPLEAIEVFDIIKNHVLNN
ncbi:MAG: alkaline phosphatase family protein, partial [Leeuwenhoekiella sp.]